MTEEPAMWHQTRFNATINGLGCDPEHPSRCIYIKQANGIGLAWAFFLL